jgi:hypothetical protein
MEDLLDVARAYGFELVPAGNGFRGKNLSWSCIIGKNLTGYGDEWVLYDNEGHRYGGKSPFEFAALLHRNVELEDQETLFAVSRKHGWMSM